MQILKDQIQEIGSNPTFLSQTGSFDKQIDVLLNFILGIGGEAASAPGGGQKTTESSDAISLKLDKKCELSREQ